MHPAPSSHTSRRFSHIRAILVAAHVAAVVLSAIPAPVGALRRSAWSEPTVAKELDGWHGRLQAVGLAGGRAEFEDDLFEFADGWLKRRARLLRPFIPYYRYLGVQQSWRMFVAPHKHPSRLQVHVRSDTSAEWELLYSHGDAEHDWHVEQLGHTRMRSALFRYAWPGFRSSFRALARWVGTEVARERPDAVQVRLQWLKERTRTPEQVRAGKKRMSKVVGPYTTDLSGLRK